VRSSCNVYGPRQWINCGQAGPLGWTLPAALGVRAADPTNDRRGAFGDYDFQFLIEELAVGAQFKLPLHGVLVNNSLPGADPSGAARLRHGLLRAAGVRQHQRPDPALKGYGMDHVARSWKAWAARRCA
jgi:tartronate-semialdehyde synthase